MAIFGLSSLLTEILILVVGSLAALYYYLTKNFNYFEQFGLKGPKPVPFFGTGTEAFKRDLLDIERDWYKTYGSVYGLFEGRKPVIVVGDPAMLRSIFQKDFHHFADRRSVKGLFDEYPLLMKTLTSLEGEEWKQLRSVVSPTFTTGKIKNMLLTMTENCDEFLENFKDYARKGEPVNIKKAFECYTMNVVASCGFGLHIDSLRNPDDPFVANARKLMQSSRKTSLILAFVIFGKFIKYLPIKLLDMEMLKYFETTLDKIIKIREEDKEAHKDRVDFLKLLLDARKSDDVANCDDAEISDPTYFREKNYSAKKILDDVTVKAQALQLFLAGFETTATSLTFVAYCLATNPEAQDKLCAELDEKLGNEKITYESLSDSNLPYLDGVISESLRMYAPAARLERRCTKNYQYENIRIPEGMHVQIPVAALHYDEKYFPEPEKFKPERFFPENRGSIQPFTYLPFGAGPRNCVGMRFALLEVKLVLATLLRQVRFTTNSQTKIPLKFFITKLEESLNVSLSVELRKREN